MKLCIVYMYHHIGWLFKFKKKCDFIMVTIENINKYLRGISPNFYDNWEENGEYRLDGWICYYIAKSHAVIHIAGLTWTGSGIAEIRKNIGKDYKFECYCNGNVLDGQGERCQGIIELNAIHFKPNEITTNSINSIEYVPYSGIGHLKGEH